MSSIFQTNYPSIKLINHHSVSRLSHSQACRSVTWGGGGGAYPPTGQNPQISLTQITKKGVVLSPNINVLRECGQPFSRCTLVT